MQRSNISAANSDKPNMRAWARALLRVLSKSVRLVDVTLPAFGVDYFLVSLFLFARSRENSTPVSNAIQKHD